MLQTRGEQEHRYRDLANVPKEMGCRAEAGATMKLQSKLNNVVSIVLSRECESKDAAPFYTHQLSQSHYKTEGTLRLKFTGNSICFAKMSGL